MTSASPDAGFGVGASRPAPDLLRLPLIGGLLRWRWGRLVLQVPLFACALALVLHGLLGPQLAPKNLATLGVWVHYRGLLVLALLAVGNLFCMACPLLLPRELSRLVVRPRLRFPRALRTKWLSMALLVAVLFVYELFDLWSSPYWTAVLMLGFFALAFLVDAFFERASFCKYVCPIGQFSFVASTLSPFEVRARDVGTCADCRTKDCIRGRREDGGREPQRGCELNLFLPQKTGNLDCTFCLDCVHACPHDNVAIGVRVPGAELAGDDTRSGLGKLSKRPDLAALVVVFSFGALLNAFAMVSPVYAFQAWLAERLDTSSEALVLGALFGLALLVEPVVLLGLATQVSRRLGQASDGWLATVTRFAYGLAPLGLGIWAAHYAFHFLTGLWTFVPVAQSAARDLGLDVLGAPDWGRGGLDAALVKPVELGLLALGLIGSLALTYRIAAERMPRPVPGFVPWAAVHAVLFAAAVWVLGQPMEMRGTFL